MAWRRGDALRSLLTQGGNCRTDVALVLDLPGPEAIAVAAALSPCVEPVFVFANWPHPLGVVPAHQTLAAALYFLPSFEARSAAARRPTRRRCSSWTAIGWRRMSTFAGQFDNRYLAGLPPVDALRSAGIRHVLYVTPDDQVTRRVGRSQRRPGRDRSGRRRREDAGAVGLRLGAAAGLAADPAAAVAPAPTVARAAGPADRGGAHRGAAAGRGRRGVCSAGLLRRHAGSAELLRLLVRLDDPDAPSDRCLRPAARAVAAGVGRLPFLVRDPAAPGAALPLPSRAARDRDVRGTRQRPVLLPRPLRHWRRLHAAARSAACTRAGSGERRCDGESSAAPTSISSATSMSTSSARSTTRSARGSARCRPTTPAAATSGWASCRRR